MVNYYQYPTSYNGTNVSSVSDFFLDYPAFISDGLMVKVIPLFIFLVLLSLMIPFGLGAALATASFISFILTTYLWWNGFLSVAYPMAFIMLTIIAAILVSRDRGL